MRVLLINEVFGTTSTGKICAQIAEQMEAEGHEVKVAFGRWPDVPEKYQRFAHYIGSDFEVKLHAIQTRLFDTHGFGSKGATREFLKWAEEYKPNLLWLHNLHGYYINVEMLFDWIKKHPEMQVKWTLHDCWAFTGHIKMVEFGHLKVDMGEPVFNYAVAYDTHNQEPLFYEKYPGSLNDISQLQFMLDKASGYGYKKIGFILDRGYFSCENIQYMDKCGYSFVIVVKGMSALVNELILENKGTFENKRVNNIYEYGVYGKTIRHKLYASDKKERYFHLYHSISKESAERIEIENRINQMTQYLKKYQNKVKEFGPGFEKYFNLHYDEKSQVFILPEERCSVVERELDLAGYFCIVTSEKMSAKEAIELYKSRDVSEKLFRGDKSYLGNKSIRVYSEESAGAKIFVEFVAMIVRCKMYVKLKEEMKKLDKKLNHMTVPAAIKELEKIEMVRQLDNIYRLDHAVTANQKVILKAFGLDANSIKYFASELSKELKKAE